MRRRHAVGEPVGVAELLDQRAALLVDVVLGRRARRAGFVLGRRALRCGFVQV
jgi:hypothetical protein